MIAPPDPSLSSSWSCTAPRLCPAYSFLRLGRFHVHGPTAGRKKVVDALGLPLWASRRCPPSCGAQRGINGQPRRLSESPQRTSTFFLSTRTTLTHHAGARCRHDTEEATIGKRCILFFHNCGLAPVPATQPHGAASQEPILDITPRTPSQHGARPQSPPPRGRRPCRTSTNREPETEPETWKCEGGVVVRCPAIYCHGPRLIPF